MKSSIQNILNTIESKINRRMLAALACVALFSSSLILSGASSCQRMVFVNEDGKETHFYSAGSTADEILKEHHISIGSQDDLTVELHENQMVIRIQRAIPVTLSVGGQQMVKTVRPSGTVAQAIQAAGVQLAQEDITDPPAESPLEKNMLIQIKRVTHTQYQKEEPLPFETIIKESQSLSPGQSTIETEGKDGTALRFYEDQYIDGQYQQTQEVGLQITNPPVSRVVLVGAAQKVSTAQKGKSELPIPADFQLDASGKPVHYSKVLTGRGCAYSARAGAHTSTGKTVMPGYIAVNPKVIPYGTKMYIVSTDGYIYGYAIAADTGTSCMNNDILADLFMNTKQECCQFGSRTLQIYLL